MSGISPEPGRALDFLKQVEEFLNKIKKSKKTMAKILKKGVKKSAHGPKNGPIETSKDGAEPSSVRLSKTSDNNNLMWGSNNFADDLENETHHTIYRNKTQEAVESRPSKEGP